jgi:2'-aminobiphenyl-2,3-diol 1,2-dioxygenase, small subunit
MSKPDINALLDALMGDMELRRQWELNPEQVAGNYALTPGQLTALLDGDIDALISEGLAERHVQQMRVSW